MVVSVIEGPITQSTSPKKRQFGSAGVRLPTDIEDDVAGGGCLLITVANGSSPLADISDAMACHRIFGRPKPCKQLELVVH
jgi:hypothetical protein